MARAAGVLYEVDGRAYFFPAAAVHRVRPAAEVAREDRLARLPGAPLVVIGAAIHEGGLVPVVALGAGRDDALVCEGGGEIVIVVGGAVKDAGFVDDAGATRFDVDRLVERIASEIRASRWGT